MYVRFKLVHFFKTSACKSSADPEILAYASNCSAKFQPILDCFIPKFKLKYKDPDNIKTNYVNTVVFNLRQIKRRTSFLGHPVVDPSNNYSHWQAFLLSTTTNAG